MGGEWDGVIVGLGRRGCLGRRDVVAQACEAIFQQRLVDRLSQPGTEERRVTLGFICDLVDRTERDEPHAGKPRIFSNGPSQRNAVHVRHVNVQHGQMDSAPGGALAIEQRQRFQAGGGGQHCGAPGGQVRFKDLPIRRIVIDDEDGESV